MSAFRVAACSTTPVRPAPSACSLRSLDAQHRAAWGSSTRRCVCQAAAPVRDTSGDAGGAAPAAAAPESVAAPSSSAPAQRVTPPSESAEDLAVALAKIAWETKGENIMVLNVSKQASWCSYMVLVTVFSRPQLNAVLGKLEKEARLVWGRDFLPTGGRSAWEILDVGDVVVNVFGSEMREHYDLESFYSSAEAVELPFLADPAAAQQQSSARDWRIGY